MSDGLTDLRLENERLARELAQARAELEDFTYSVSHDLRASLRHVSAYVQIIREDLDHQSDAGVVKHLDTVSQAAKQMGRQIDGLMELARLTRVEIQPSPLDVGALVDDIFVELAPRLVGRTLAWDIASDMPALRGDSTLVRQLFSHLLGNAVKFTAPRSAAVVNVSWQLLDSDRCALTVRDNGVGFNPHYKSKLFHAFQRLHGARDFEGLGMGLALSRKIVERHGGSVWADGAPETGCSVSFTLPLAKPT
jgi:light-regulated signal transduction histidine kinase (bacteriophytochrome)